MGIQDLRYSAGNSPLRVNNKSAINCNKNANTIVFIRLLYRNQVR